LHAGRWAGRSLRMRRAATMPARRCEIRTRCGPTRTNCVSGLDLFEPSFRHPEARLREHLRVTVMVRSVGERSETRSLSCTRNSGFRCALPTLHFFTTSLGDGERAVALLMTTKTKSTAPLAHCAAWPAPALPSLQQSWRG